jgi:hypothetical protein
MAPLLEEELRQYVALREKIKASFGGNPFLPDEPPTSAENMRRFRAYIGMRKSATMMIVKVTHELMRARGVDSELLGEYSQVPDEGDFWLEQSCARKDWCSGVVRKPSQNRVLGPA